MKNLKSPKILAIIATSLTLWVCVFSYYSFAKFKPSAIQEEPKVKGAKAYSVVNDLPTIPDSTELSSQKSPEAGYINFKTELDSNAVQKFYYNVLTAKEWKMTGDSTQNKSRILAFKKASYEIDIHITKDNQDNKQLVSVQYRKN